MVEIDKKYLSTLYKFEEINQVWQDHQNKDVIEHPKFGLISPNKLRVKYKEKPCPYCGKKMVNGKDLFTTTSKEEAYLRKWQYTKGIEKIINQADNFYFHPNYTSIDHILNKARFPEKMFDYDNLQVICWKCNNLKGDNNNFDSEQIQKCLDSLTETALEKYKL